MKSLFPMALLAVALPLLAQPTLPSGAYTYDGAGNITAIGTNTYSYDSLGRLTKAVIVSGGITHTQELTYDAYGNMTSTKTDGVVAPIGIDANTNRLTDVVADAYDEAGNLRIDGSLQYTYDSLGQMSEKVAPAVHEYYIYDANDERIAVRAAPDNWQFTFRDLGGKPLRSFRASELNNWSQQWTWVQDWVWRDGQLLGSEHPPTDGGRQHYHLDHLGTPRLATAANGLVVARHDYYPYGVEITPLRQEVAAGFSQEQAMKFTGHERDFTGGTAQENTNYLDYMHARSYSAAWGRFLSIDPITANYRTPQAWNRYVYSMNSPVSYVDPDGRCSFKLTDGSAYSDDNRECIEVTAPHWSAADLRRMGEDAVARERAIFLAEVQDQARTLSYLRPGDFFNGKATVHGLEAFVDGVVPDVPFCESEVCRDISDPFAANGYYDVNEPGMRSAQVVGAITRDIEVALATSGSTRLFGRGSWANSNPLGAARFRVGHSIYKKTGETFFSMRGTWIDAFRGASKSHIDLWIIK